MTVDFDAYFSDIVDVLEEDNKNRETERKLSEQDIAHCVAQVAAGVVALIRRRINHAIKHNI